MKNKLMLVSLFLIAFLVTIGVALADIQASTLELGSSSQERGNYITSIPWTIKNTGTATITDIAVTFPGVDAKYNATAVLSTTTLAENDTTNVLITIFVPLNQDSGRKKLNGNIQVTATGTTAATHEIYLEAVNHLEINEIRVDVGNNDDKLTSPGKIGEDADLGDDIEISIEVENTFDENIEIEDIDITMKSDLDEADDFDDSISNLEDGEDEKIVFTFTLDEENVDPTEAPFTLTIKVKGIDENGAIHQEEWDIELDMNVESRDVRVIDISLSKSVVSCGDTIKIDYDLRNVGKRDTEDAMVKFEISDLNIGTWERNLDINSDDIESFSTSLKIPDNAKTGIYLIEMTAYATDSTSDDTDEETISFEVRTCGEKEDVVDKEDDKKTNTTPIVITPNVPAGNDNGATGTPGIVPAIPVTSSTGVSKSPLGDATTYVIVLGIIVLLLLIAVVVLLARLASK